MSDSTLAMTEDGRGLWIAALLGIAALTVVRWAVLAFSPMDLYGDEAQYWTWAQTFDFGYFTKPPLIAWVIGATTWVLGDGPFGVRAAAPLLHGLTAIVVGLIGHRLFDRRVGAWSALTYALIPGVSLSSVLISTDVALLLCWSVALYALVRLIETRGFGWALACGVAIGVGLMAKYAMGYFVMCMVLYAVFTPGRRWMLMSWQTLTLAVCAVLLFAPNVIWNVANGWATVGHTADNANWGNAGLHVGKALEFVGAQFGVFGPILAAALIVLAWTWARRREGVPMDPAIRLLLIFSLPVLALITMQALVSRAHANWAATAYIAASVAVAAVLAQAFKVRRRRPDHGLAAQGGEPKYIASPRPLAMLAARLLPISTALHLIIAAGLYAALVWPSLAGWLGARDPTARIQGWSILSAAVFGRAESDGRALILGDDRMLLATLIYYGRDTDLAFAALDNDGVPGNHYEMTMPYRAGDDRPALWVSLYPATSPLTPWYGEVGAASPIAIPVNDRLTRRVYLLSLDAPLPPAEAAPDTPARPAD